VRPAGRAPAAGARFRLGRRFDLDAERRTNVDAARSHVKTRRANQAFARIPEFPGGTRHRMSRNVFDGNVIAAHLRIIDQQLPEANMPNASIDFARQ
jgi:hypothetical protein